MSRVPRLSTAAPRPLDLTPEEAFLLSQVDALLDEHALALVAGMTPAEVSAALDRLALLGAIEIVEAGAQAPGARERASKPPPSPARATPPLRPSDAGHAVSVRPVSISPAHPQAAPNPGPAERAPVGGRPAEQEEGLELGPERKARVQGLYDRLDELTYYALLGVAPQAEKKQIKSAYYALAPDFHPDKYFRKNLGAYRQKIEAIFARITLAHDVLTDRARRAEYDAYLEQTQKNEKLSSVFDDAPPDVSAILAAVEQAAARAMALGTAPAAPVPPAATPGAPLGDRRPSSASIPIQGRPSSPSIPVQGRPSSPSMPAQGRPSSPSIPIPGRPSSPSIPAVVDTPLPPGISPEEALRLRREALARKLVGGARRPTPAPAPAPVPPPRSSAPAMAELERAAEAMRVRREAALAEAKRDQIARLLDAGASAMSQEDYAGAANSYRLAASLAPDDVTIQARCADALRRAMAALADGYWKQAVYEEGQERWSEASLSYSRVCTGQPGNAPAHERVAFTTLKAGGNPRRAVEFGRKAVELDPKKPDYHVTLARAYAAAGLEKSAGGELDRALELGPGDPRVKALVASARQALAQKDAR